MLLYDYTIIATTLPESHTTLKSENYVSTIDQTTTPAPADVTHFSEGMDDAIVARAPLVQIDDSFPSDAPNEMMARVRKLATFTWSSTDVIDRTYTFNFTNELLISLSQIINYNNWKHFRYDHIIIRLTVNTSRFFKGAMLVSTVTSPQSSGNFYLTTLGLSQMPSSILDATATQTLEVAIPWLSPIVKQTSSFFATDETGYTSFSVLSPLGSETAIGVDVSVTVSIEANFVNPKLINPYPGAFPVPALRARFGYGPPAYTVYLTQGPNKGKNGVVSEASKKAKQGALTAISESVNSISSSLVRVPIIGPFAEGISLISSVSTKFFDWLGLSKPINVTTPQYVMQNSNPFSQTFHGVTTAVPMSSDIVPYVSTDPHLLADTADACNLMRIATDPSIVLNAPIPTTVAGVPVIVTHVAVSPTWGFGDATGWTLSNTAYVSQFFRNWRGEMSYKLYVPASIMSRQRIIVTHTIDKPSVWSEIYRSQYYEIQGSTVIDITVPWIIQSPYLPCPQLSAEVDNPSPNGYLTIWAATPLVNENPGVTPTALRCIVFGAATASTQFAVFRCPTLFRVLVNLLQGSFGATSSGNLDTFLCEDDISSLREIAHRPSFIGTTDVSAGGNFFMPRTFPSFMKYVIGKHRFFRGSINVQIVYKLPPFNAPIIKVCRYTSDSADTTVLWCPSVEPILNITIPWDGAYGYTGTGADNYLINFPFRPFVVVPATAGLTLDWYISFNDDFSLGVQTFSPLLEPPPP